MKWLTCNFLSQKVDFAAQISPSQSKIPLGVLKYHPNVTLGQLYFEGVVISAYLMHSTIEMNGRLIATPNDRLFPFPQFGHPQPVGRRRHGSAERVTEELGGLLPDLQERVRKECLAAVSREALGNGKVRQDIRTCVPAVWLLARRNTAPKVPSRTITLSPSSIPAFSFI